ncbi:biotin carboxyl carrier protein of acetyl-CoA carboxylase [Mangifera indica]|uniref:biotin carboxyl carrier protein of acetyl-CoA carboxylase n=1 Tax=Mangifera indica TaxID=29780 RepID=UPI001CFC1653|nr:biotin carboxyl carrier protein of acetyl-CoA carboxylase [Mangifera indica]
MASCSLGAPNVKFLSVNLRIARAGDLQPQYDVRKWMGQKQLQYTGLTISRPVEKAFTVCCGLETESKRSVDDDYGETKSSGLTSQLIPNSSEVKSLVRDICDTTSVAEFELKLNGFRLYVKRDLKGNSVPPPPLSAAPVSINTTVEAPDSNGSVPSPSPATTKPVLSLERVQTLPDKAADEGLMILQSPKVGFFRRSRTIKGKRAPPSCKEKQIVKEGQVLCYIEQLGGEIPIESDVSGEVIKILREDGEPVGYGDALIAILPSFPGIKKLQ